MRFRRIKNQRRLRGRCGSGRFLLSLCFALALGHARPVLAQSNGSGGIAGVQAETLTGRNTTGPYWLAWRGIRPGSETIDRNGVTLRPGTDYTLDAVAGMIAFAAPLQITDKAYLSYRADLPDAAPNSASPAVPLDLDVWQSGVNRLSIHSYFDPKRAADSAAPLSLLQWTGATRYGKRGGFRVGGLLRSAWRGLDGA